MGKEDKLLRKVGTSNPFRVPEHYFENFTQELMSKLPEKEPMPLMPEPTLWQRVKPWVYMTAMFCGIMLSVRIFVGEPQKDEFSISQTEAEMLPEEEWENFVRRAFDSNYETYQFLTEARNNQ
ncbi:MAG: hypothetical protein IKU64_01240 [Bacteroides sp.]|nr:hypothetical protein [Bacteroides sp.]